MKIEYKRCKSNFVSELRFPVYAGEDGSIVVFNTTRCTWEQLNQTYDLTNGYWVFSVPKKNPVYTEKPTSEIDVHRLICTAWRGDHPPTQTRVDHVNGDPDDNSAKNLKWISTLKNALKANKHQKQFPSGFRQLIIDCDAINSGADVSESVSIVMIDGTMHTARELFGHGRGRPITRIGSLIETIYRASVIQEENKLRARRALSIDSKDVSAATISPYPDSVVVTHLDVSAEVP